MFTLRRSQRRALAVLASATLLATGSALAVALPQASAATIDPNAYYQLISRYSGKAIAIEGAATADAAAVVQWAPGSGQNQQFRFLDSGGGYYRLQARHSGKVLDVYEWNANNGAEIRQWPDLNGTNQQFQVVDTDGGHVKLINRFSGKALDVWEWSTADGGRISQYNDTGGTNQQWQLVQVGGPTAAPTPSATPAQTTAPPTSTPPTNTPTQPPPAYPQPGLVTGSTGAHDPTMVKRPDGSYLVATTGNGIALKTSTDRIAFSNAGAVWPNGASWTTPYTGGSLNLWAPDLSFHNGRYYLYYSASSFGSRNSAIFLATSTTGAAGSWTHEGLVIETSNSNDYNAIDPNLIVDTGGQWWLTFGSFWTGIKLIRLDNATGLRSTSDTAIRSLATRPNAGGAIEAPIIFRHDGRYYLFVAFDLCCRGADSTYRIMVGRSDSLAGPYLDRNGTPMTAGGGTEVLSTHGNIIGPGHPAVMSDLDGTLLIYHYYTPSDAALLGINLLGFDSAGWPFAY
jgi:arabinan endo-1,5-alpha-L-arabinosidase